MKQTAVEFLEFRYKNNINLMDYDFEQAKEMEKENMINFLKSIFQQDGFDYEKAYEQFKNK